ncbi:recombinase family protein (plasmid) [Cereibacter azotoformans]|uniref:Resolvase, N-terminal domain n=1 Tax=Cereibacter sphaeroides (strain ATCC 17025 / ATH 2.4.3) TaxID=349102 RepID=A4X0R3_CERS5|nr:recombinase family protein [Cereibacter azotoformans]ULB12803.1 recombinase family protein [Cereibacter azotoformans]
MLVGYALVSTRDQLPQLQIDALSAAGCKRIFEEKPRGAARERPQFAAALEYMRAGDTLVVWKLDCLARSTAQLIETVGTLQQHGIGFRCVSKADIDTTAAGGKLIYTIFSAIAEFEAAMIRERIRAGLGDAPARGRRGGRPPALSSRELAVARAMLRNPELTVEQVARQVGVSPATLYRHLPGGRSAVRAVELG